MPHRQNKHVNQLDAFQIRGHGDDALLQAFEIVRRLAEWSAKYPRQQVHSFSAKVDEQLIEIENAAKAWMDGQNDLALAQRGLGRSVDEGKEGSSHE